MTRLSLAGARATSYRQRELLLDARHDSTRGKRSVSFILPAQSMLTNSRFVSVCEFALENRYFRRGNPEDTPRRA